LRPLVHPHVAYIFNGSPRVDHYLTPEQRAASPRIAEETQEIFWAFIIEYGGVRGRVWYLEFIRALILSALFTVMIHIVNTDLFANKKVAIRLKKERLCWYTSWLIITPNLWSLDCLKKRRYIFA